MQNKWGEGIPQYTSADIMTDAELLHFAMQIVFDFELKTSGYELLGSNASLDQTPNFVAKKDSTLYFIVVKASIAPEMPTLSSAEREQILNHAKSHNAVACFAPVGFGSCDAERFNASLALRDDGFYSNYRGLEYLTD